MFGPERTGLVNEDITLADTVLNVPLNPGFSSLNLAQAVLIVGYEWFIASERAAGRDAAHRPQPAGDQGRAGLNFFDHLEEELVDSGFIRHPESRPSMVRNLRSLFQRAHCTEQELRTLHGVVTAFAGPRGRGETMELGEPDHKETPDRARQNGPVIGTDAICAEVIAIGVGGAAPALVGATIGGRIGSNSALATPEAGKRLYDAAVAALTEDLPEMDGRLSGLRHLGRGCRRLELGA